MQGDAGHTAALVIAKVAAIEVPRKQWPELIEALLANMGATPSSRELRQSTLEALGYTCEELGNLDDDFLSQLEVNSILTAVVQVGADRHRPEWRTASSARWRLGGSQERRLGALHSSALLE
jgi:importin subunit beta-1